jgi:hypothetical protein
VGQKERETDRQNNSKLSPFIRLTEADFDGSDGPDVADNPVGNVHLAEVPEVVRADQTLAGVAN